jgi:HAD superfamily hydrolase (TIGR01509 family)
MPPMPTPFTDVEVLLLDADGNLFPTEEPAFEASASVLNRLMEEVGSPERFDGDALRRTAMGRTFRNFSAELAKTAGVELAPGDVERWVATEAREVTAHLGRVITPDPEVSEVLDALAPRVAMAVVSSSALARLDACFEASDLARLLPADRRYSAEDSLAVPTSKPDPAVYLHACERLGADPGRCVAVEDAEAGALSAVAAGIPTVGNLFFVAEDERETRRAVLEAAGVAAVIESWRELPALLG